MQALFTICFGVGIGYIVIGFILGEVIGLIDFDLDTDISFDGLVSPLKPSVIAAFLTVFGGGGLIFYKRFDAFYAVMLAVIAGLIVSTLFYRFVIVPLYKAQNTSAVEKQSLIGHNATVTEKIPQGGYGKITYHASGNTYSSPAKSEDGTEISRNEAVEIIYIEKNTYYVRRK